MQSGVFITYSEVIGELPNEYEVSQTIASLNKKDTFFFLSMINNFLALYPLTYNEEKYVYLQRFLSTHLFSSDVYNKLAKYVEDTSLVSRPIFHRPTVLFLMKRVLLEAKDEGGLEPGKNSLERYILGEVCLKLGDLLVSEEQQARTRSDNPTEEKESERILSELLTQMLPFSELMNPPEFSRSLARTNRYLNLSKEYSKATFDDKSMLDFFESKRGISLDTFLQMTTGIYGALIVHDVKDFIERPQEFNIRKSSHFSNLNYDKVQIESFFSLLAQTFEALNETLKNSPISKELFEQFDYTTFRKYPLFYLSEDIVTSCDASFLIEKFSFGLYHTVLNLLLEFGKNPEPFFSDWGYVFEKYVNETFRAVYPEISGRFHANAFFETKSEKEGFDGLLEYPTALIAMEYKSGLLNAKAKYSGKAEILLKEMATKFGCSTNRSAIKQLCSKIEFLFHTDAFKRQKLRNLDFPNVNNIYPVLIVNELSLEFGLAHWRLRTWFEKELGERSILKSVKVHPLMVMTIEDLENLIPYLDAEDFTFLEFAQYYSRLEYMRFSWWLVKEHWYEPMTTLMDVLSRFRKENKISRRPNQHMQNEFEKFINEMSEHFESEGD